MVSVEKSPSNGVFAPFGAVFGLFCPIDPSLLFSISPWAKSSIISSLQNGGCLVKSGRGSRCRLQRGIVESGIVCAKLICWHDTVEASSNRRARDRPVHRAGDSYRDDLQILRLCRACPSHSLRNRGLCDWAFPVALAGSLKLGSK